MNLSRQLNMLESSGLVRLVQVEPELDYAFRHALVQEAAYSSLLKHDRRRLHLAVGETLERLYPDRPDELAGTLSHHFAAAGERDKGVMYARRAAQRAVAMYAYEEAQQYLQSALGLVPAGEVSQVRLELLEELADVHRALRQGRRTISTYHDALNLWKELQDADPMIEVRLHRKILEAVIELKWAITPGEYEAAIEVSRDSLAGLEAGARLREGATPHPEMVRLFVALSTAAWRIQTPPNWVAALLHAEAAVKVAKQLDHPVELSAALDALALALFAHGRLKEHLQVALRRLDLGKDPRFDDVRERVDGLRGAGSALMYVGEYAKAIPHLLEAHSLAERIQAVDQQFNALSLLTQCWFRMDRWDEALRSEEECHKLESRHTRLRVGPICFPIAIGSVVYRLRGDLETARSLRAESFRIMVASVGPPEQWPIRNAHY